MKKPTASNRKRDAKVQTVLRGGATGKPVESKMPVGAIREEAQREKSKDTISSLRGELTDARYRSDQYKQLYYGSINSIERLELTVEALSEALRRERRQEKDIPF